MIPWGLILKNAKLILIIAIAGYAVWHVRDYIDLKKENKRLDKNAEALRTEKKNDSVVYSDIILTKDEFIQDMQYNHQEQWSRIEERLNININQIKKLQTIKTEYINNDTTTYVLNKILKGLEENKPAGQKVVDSTECYLVEAYIHTNGRDLRMDLQKVAYTNITEIVAYAERKKWWLPWKWFKKRKISVSVLNSCGKTETRIVNIKKK